jgi:histidine triad (HIT) family protein
MVHHQGRSEECIFCDIVQKQLPAAVIWEDERYLAFLDIKAIKPGHTLLIPKKHVDYFFDLDELDYRLLFDVARLLANHLRIAMDAKKIGIAVKGFQVPHAHLHLVPLYKSGELDFRLRESPAYEELERIARKIRIEIER